MNNATSYTIYIPLRFNHQQVGADRFLNFFCLSRKKRNWILDNRIKKKPYIPDGANFNANRAFLERKENIYLFIFLNEIDIAVRV